MQLMNDRFTVRLLLAFCVVALGGTGIWAYTMATRPAPGTVLAAQSMPTAKEPAPLNPREMIDFEFVEDKITGTVKNIHPTKTMEMAYLTFGLYDEAGNRVGTASALMTELKPGETWKFNASARDKDAVTAKLIGFKVR